MFTDQKFIIVNIDLYIQCNANQNPSKLFYRSRQTDSNTHMEMQGMLNNQNNFEKENNYSYLKNYYKTTVIKTV